MWQDELKHSLPPSGYNLSAERGVAVTNRKRASLEQYLNMPELLARVENDRELLAELFALFQGHFPRLRDALRGAVDSCDPSQAEKAAHTLKGMLANLSINRGAELAANVEAAARAGDVQKIQQAVALFDQEEAGLLEAVNLFATGGKR